MSSRTRLVVLLFCLAVTLLALLTPVARMVRHAEWSYNEGWNVAGAMRLSAGALSNPQLPRTTRPSPLAGGCCQTELYPAAWGWTTVNYPVLSFALMAALHRVTGEYLWTGRAVSLLSLMACAVLLASIARAMGATRWAAWLTGLLCVATFAVCAIDYVGVDDPQLLGDTCFLAALFVYVRGRRHGALLPTYGTVALVAGIFVVAGCVKQSPVDVPLAVLADLVLLSRRRAGWFAACGVVFGVLAGMLNRYVGGPWFVQELLLGRLYSPAKAGAVLLSVLGPMLVPLVLAGWAAWQVRLDPRRRLAGLLLVTSIAVGGYFGGGSGVAGNALFTALFAIVLLLGLLVSDAVSARCAVWLPVLAFGWLIVPALVQSIANPVANLREAAASERRFAKATNLLRQHPGPALCESMLLCLEAGKPYVFDPFNATRLMLQGRLSQAALVADIDAHRFTAIQLHTAIAGGHEPDELMPERFPAPVLQAIDHSYTLAHADADGAIYLPRRANSPADAASR